MSVRLALTLSEPHSPLIAGACQAKAIFNVLCCLSLRDALVDIKRIVEIPRCFLWTG